MIRTRQIFTLLLAGLVTVSAHGEEPAKPAKPEPLFDGKTLKNWAVIDKFVYDEHGEVKVVDGAIRMNAGQPGTAITYQGKPPRDNYELVIEAQRVEGNDFFCGLTIPVAEQQVTLIMGGWGGGTVGLSNVDNANASENETTTFIDFKNGQWYKIRVRVTAKAIQVFVDEREEINLAREDRNFDIWWEQEPCKPLGIATWYTTAAIRKIEVTRLPE